MKIINRLIAIIFVFLALVLSLNVYAQEEGVFLCMRGGDSTALYSDGKTGLMYIDMISSNGADATPIISADGNTYLPFRFVCEMAGLKDAQEGEDDLESGHFRFTDNGGIQTIEINYNDKYIAHQVGVEFSYELEAGDIRNVCIYNIDGTLYFPMTYLAKITNATALWNGKTKDIMYIDNNINPSDFIDEEFYIHDYLLEQNGFYLNYNKTDDDPVCFDAQKSYLEDVSEQIGEEVICATKTNGTIFGVTQTGDIKYKSSSGNFGVLNFKVDTIIAVKNRLYGIERDTKKGFVCRLDGTDFEYITDMPVFNLILREYNNEFYLYYCEYENSSKIHMIQLKTMDTYDIEITDYEYNNLIYDVEKFVVGTKMFAYVDGNSQLHTIVLDEPLEEFEIAVIPDGNVEIIDYYTYCEENGVINR